MSTLDEDLLLKTAQQAIALARDLSALEQVRVDTLGRKSPLTQAIKAIAQCSPEERPRLGKTLNQLKNKLVSAIDSQEAAFSKAALALKLKSEAIDVTLPGRGPILGALHPITQVRLRLEKIFAFMGFEVVSGPEVENPYYNFEALNIPAHHPARTMHDTFYLEGGDLLRTHTSSVQIRVMENKEPPLRIVTPGRVYRCDSDNTHTPMFNQIEGLLVDEVTNFSDLKGLLEQVMRAFFEQPLDLRFRPSYFPYTEPSAEVDIQCVKCQGKGCRVCSHTGWLEILGCGMVHPKVLENVGIDHEYINGFAFGMGIDRLTMLYYGIDDLRLLFENDLSLLEQF